MSEIIISHYFMPMSEIIISHYFMPMSKIIISHYLMPMSEMSFSQFISIIVFQWIILFFNSCLKPFPLGQTFSTPSAYIKFHNIRVRSKERSIAIFEEDIIDNIINNYSGWNYHIIEDSIIIIQQGSDTALVKLIH